MSDQLITHRSCVRWVKWVMGSHVDGSHGSWVTLRDPFAALLHSTSRNRDDVLKERSNLLSKHKPLIADKIASMKKNGTPGSELTPLEEKIQSIKGKGVVSGGSRNVNPAGGLGAL